MTVDEALAATASISQGAIGRGSRSRLSLAAKRALDLGGSVAGLVVLSPFLAAVALAIWLDDRGSPVFRQDRAGLDGRPFRVVKFRTMRVGADGERAALRSQNEIAGGASFKMSADPRVTRVGNVLRRTSLDELPQLWNVLVGEMSLVGPRPHPFDDLDGYKDWHFRRLTVKPGITGLWQISARNDPDFDNWVRLDLEYIDNWTVLGDLRILAGTIPAVFRADGR